MIQSAHRHSCMLTTPESAHETLTVLPLSCSSITGSKKQHAFIKGNKRCPLLLGGYLSESCHSCDWISSPSSTYNCSHLSSPPPTLASCLVWGEHRASLCPWLCVLVEDLRVTENVGVCCTFSGAGISRAGPELGFLLCGSKT